MIITHHQAALIALGEGNGSSIRVRYQVTQKTPEEIQEKRNKWYKVKRYKLLVYLIIDKEILRKTLRFHIYVNYPKLQLHWYVYLAGRSCAVSPRKESFVSPDFNELESEKNKSGKSRLKGTRGIWE